MRLRRERRVLSLLIERGPPKGPWAAWAWPGRYTGTWPGLIKVVASKSVASKLYTPTGHVSGASVMSVSTAPHLGSAETLIGLELKIACDTKRAHEQQQQAHKERVLIPSTIIFIAW